MTKTPHVIPLKMFFVPHSISSDDWVELGYQAGIIFDRFRISHFSEKTLPKILRSSLQKWNRSAFTNKEFSLTVATG